MTVGARAAVHAALGEPVRLAIVDRLGPGDASPGELRAVVGLPTNLLAHHLKVLDEAGLIRRVRSEGDRRRSYVQLSSTTRSSRRSRRPAEPAPAGGRGWCSSAPGTPRGPSSRPPLDAGAARSRPRRQAPIPRRGSIPRAVASGGGTACGLAGHGPARRRRCPGRGPRRRRLRQRPRGAPHARPAGCTGRSRTRPRPTPTRPSRPRTTRSPDASSGSPTPSPRRPKHPDHRKPDPDGP